MPPLVIRNNRLAARQTIGFALFILMSVVVMILPLVSASERVSGNARVVVLAFLAAPAALIGLLGYCVVRAWLLRAVIDDRGVRIVNFFRSPFVPWSEVGGVYTETIEDRLKRKPWKSGPPWPVAVLTRKDGTRVRVRVTSSPSDKAPSYLFANQVRGRRPGDVPA